MLEGGRERCTSALECLGKVSKVDVDGEVGLSRAVERVRKRVSLEGLREQVVRKRR